MIEIRYNYVGKGMVVAPLFVLRSMLLLTLLFSALVEAITSTHILKENLLSRTYDADIRPVIKPDDMTEITIIPNEYILLMMDQQQETIRFFGEFMQTWVDPHLTWNRSEFDYHKDWIKIPESIVWTPGVIFYAATDKTELIPLEERLVDLKYDGTIRQSNPTVIELPCSLRIEDFPFDEQICSITMGPWNFDDTQVNLKSSAINFAPENGKFEGNSEWELVSMKAVEEKKPDTFYQSTFPTITYKVTLKRKPVYYILVIQAPTFIVSTLTIFGLFTPFRQDHERREKVTLGLNMFVSISMMLNLVSDMMPKASRLPLLGNYILAEIFVCGVAVLVSIVILTLHQKCHTRVLQPPPWVIRIVFFRCSRKVAETKKKESQLIKETAPPMKPFGKLHDSLHKTIQAVNQELEYIENADKIRKMWITIFDRIDLMCLILFQFFNIIASALFMR